MRTKLVCAGILAALLCVGPALHQAVASSIGPVTGHIRISGIPGEATAALYEGWTELHDFRFGLQRATDGAAIKFQPLRIIKVLDKSSPLLYQALVDGAHLPQVKIEIARESEGRQLRWWRVVLQDVVVTEARLEQNQVDASETIVMQFAKATVEYSLYDLSGRLTENHAFFWDLLQESGGELPSPILRASGELTPDGNLRLQWPGRIGATYRVRSSPRIEGPYEIIRTVEASEHGTLSQTLPLAATTGFVVVEEVP